MEIKNINKRLYVLIFGVMLITIIPELFSSGMFLDGVTYSAISRNLSLGIGELWKPHYTDALFSSFFEHPPLVFWIQSIFFKIIGDNFYTERIYSLLTGFVTFKLIGKIWINYVDEKDGGYKWLPILIWVSLPLTRWSYASNLLENTMTIFVMLSVLFLIKSVDKKSVFNKEIVFSSFFISLGFLSKGPFALYPWIFYLIYYIIFKKPKQTILRTIIFVFLSVLPIIIIMALMPEAKEGIMNYLNKQVFGSIANVKTVDTRFDIIFELIKEFSLYVLIIVVVIIKKYFKIDFKNIEYKRKILFIFLFALSGVIPIMISMKQRSFYILATLPLFSIGFSLLFLPKVRYLVNLIDEDKQKYISYISIILVCVSILIIPFMKNNFLRNKDKIRAARSIQKLIPFGSRIEVRQNSLSKNWRLIAYFARYGNNSLVSKNINSKYLLVDEKSENSISNKDDFKIIKINNSNYSFYEKSHGFR